MSVRLCLLVAALATAMGLGLRMLVPVQPPIPNFSADWNIGSRWLPTSTENGLSGRGSAAHGKGGSARRCHCRALTASQVVCRHTGPRPGVQRKLGYAKCCPRFHLFHINTAYNVT